jgi:hypothetical protein
MRNLSSDPENVEDQGLKATILAFRPARRAEAIKLLETLARANRLGNDERFQLARLYLDQRDEQKYQDEMLKLLNLRVRDPQQSALASSTRLSKISAASGPLTRGTRRTRFIWPGHIKIVNGQPRDP